MGESAERAHQQRDGHGRGHALAAHVANDDEHAAVLGSNDLKEIAAHLARRIVHSLNLEARDRRHFVRDKHFLHGARCLQLGFERSSSRRLRA